jgi:Septin
VIVMKKLSEVVNVVPVIAKSDSLTLEERERFKLKVYYLLVLVFCSYFLSLYRLGRSWSSTALIRILLTQTRTTKKRFILTKLLG